MYPSEWKGSAESPTGVATFRIEGKTFLLRCACFKDYQMVSNMLELAFDQGKSFAARGMRSQIEHAMNQAESTLRSNVEVSSG